MAAAERPRAPKTFFLNERQELASFDREGGGRSANFVAVDWSKRAATLTQSFARVAAPPRSSRDPAISGHRFIVAIPVSGVAKHSESKKAGAAGGTVIDVPTFAGEQSKLFRKMGMDLIETLPGGKATVHVPVTRIEQLIATMHSLPTAAAREKSRWINFDAFEPIDWSSRIDLPWLHSLTSANPIEVAIKFQPALTRAEAQDVAQAIVDAIGQDGKLLRAGREFSGRYWCAGVIARQGLELLAREFQSIQSIVPRSTTPVAARSRTKARPVVAVLPSFSVLPAISVAQLPTVAIVDTGIPEQHPLLGAYRRPGYRNPNLDPMVHYMGDHGSVVASCATFGRLDFSAGVTNPAAGACRVMDVMVSVDSVHIDDVAVVTALETVVATAPDVRVFNLSFGGAPLATFAPTQRREELIKLQDLDNLAFARDILLVIAAGNTPVGLLPEHPYPRHIDDPRWALGTHARSFNGAICGAYVDNLGSEPVAGILGAPSPFTRVGPGLCGAPVPGFGAPGGDGLSSYRWAPGTGIWACTSSGAWEDHVGTSVATPLLAREAAWMFHELAKRCGGQTVPFVGTVKAWMALVAQRPTLQGQYERLASRTLGRGLPIAQRLQQPLDRSAVFVWQVVLSGPKTVSRVQFPLPRDWLVKASAPHVRVVAAWNTPVNAALLDSWGCRKVGIKIRPFGAAEALVGGGNAHGSYPIIDRTFDITPSRLTDKGFTINNSAWVLECEYEEIGEYPPAMAVSNQQRVGVVVELWDSAEQPVSPQQFVQALPMALELDRLGVLQQPFEVPITIKS
jgi:hypothetical protein